MLTFRLKTILGIALIEIVLLVILVTMSLGYLSDSNEEQLRYRANSIAQLFAKSVQDAVLSYDLATLDSLVQHLLTDPEIVYIRIANNDEVLAVGGDSRMLKQQRSLDTSLQQVDDAVFDVAAPIQESGRRYGTVTLGLSTGVIDAVVSEARRYMSSIALGEVLLVALFSLVLGTYLTRRLRQLEAASTAIGENGPGHQIPVHGNDEIAHTVRAFNEMSTSLARSSEESANTQEAYRQLALLASSNEAIAKATLAACLDGIVTINQQGEVVEYNNQAEQIFGWPRDEMIGSAMVDTIIPAELRENHKKGMSRYLQTGEGRVLNQRLELPAMHCDGHRITIEISIAAMATEPEPLFTAFIRDISQQKAANKAIEKARQAADQANQAKSRFLATMSHEIRSPLNAVVNMNELLFESQLDEEQKELARIAREGGLTLLSLINDILDFSRIESDKVEIRNRPMNPMQTLQSVVELHSGIAFRRGICLQTVIPPAFDRMVLCDEMRFRQIVTNLVSNALKFTNDGGVIVRIDADQDPGFFRVSVSDSGEGIDRQRHDEVFKEFRQLEDDSKRRFSGSGLGLAITHRLVELMGGSIELESTPGIGSEFTVHLPLLDTDSGPGATKPEHSCMDTDAVVVNVENPVLRVALLDLCKCWGIPAFAPEFAVEQVNQEWRHIAMLVDADRNDEQLPRHQITAQQIAPLDRWRFITVSPIQMRETESKSGDTTAYHAVLRTPIRAESLVRFVCHLRCDECATAPTEKSKPDRPARETHVLLVDDSAANLAVGKALLSRMGCRVDAAEDGLAAIELADRQPYDIIFMDLAMPRMDGLEATRSIREQQGPNQTTPIIALTANAFVEDREKCFAQGMTDYLSKPVDRTELHSLVNRYAPLAAPWPVTKPDLPASLETSTDYSDLAILDQNTLDRIAKDTSLEAIPEILAIYLDELQKRVPVMLAHQKNGDLVALGDEAHALKSSSASFGATRLAQLARDIEIAARNSNADETWRWMADLESISGASMDALRVYLITLGNG
jgi:PAS domain S-box-containing protein